MATQQRSFTIEKRSKFLFFFKKWRIRRIYARPGDQITLTSRSSFDVWFPPLRNPVDIVANEGSPSNQITLNVKADAMPGRYEFSLFCYDDNQMAIGKSSPSMIIRR